MTNVLFYHGWVTREQVNEVFVRAEELMNKHEVKKNGDVVTATREIEMREGQPVMNLEVFIPIDKEIVTSGDFGFMKEFKIENALKIRIEGNIQQAEAAMQKLVEYMESNELQASTPAYMVTVKGATTPMEIDEMITDIYVGVMKK